MHTLAKESEEERLDRCCDTMDEAYREVFTRKHYGITVATDILNAHKKDVEDLAELK